MLGDVTLSSELEMSAVGLSVLTPLAFMTMYFLKGGEEMGVQRNYWQTGGSIPQIFLNYLSFSKNCSDLGYLNVKMHPTRWSSYLHLCDFFITHRNMMGFKILRNEISFLCAV